MVGSASRAVSSTAECSPDALYSVRQRCSRKKGWVRKKRRGEREDALGIQGGDSPESECLLRRARVEGSSEAEVRIGKRGGM